MSETFQTKVDVDDLMRNVNREIYKQKKLASSEFNDSLYEIVIVKKTIGDISDLLQALQLKNQEKPNLPPELSRLFPLAAGRKMESLIMKIYNYAFRKQRSINADFMSAINYLISVNQELQERIDYLESKFED